jgi:tight adherence protein C
MTRELWLFIGFFSFVMTGIIALGYVLIVRPAHAEGNDGDGIPDALSLAGPEVPSTKGLVLRAFRFMGEAVPAAQAESNPVRKLLIAAGHRWSSALPVFYGIKCATSFLIGIVIGWAGYVAQESAGMAIIPGLCGAAFGFMLPDRILEFVIKTRRRRLRSALPPALDLLVLSVEAGQSLNQALLETSRELKHSHPDLSDELALVHLALRAGTSRAEAFRQLGDRNGEQELRKLSSVLIDSDRFGTSLAPALRTHSKYLRTRMRQQAQEAARKVSVKLVFPVFFLIFPAILLVTLGPAVLQMHAQLKLMLQ